MQFTTGKGVTLFVGIVFCACGLGFASGVLIGRQFPAHRYERFGESWYLLDPTTGKVCNPLKAPNASTNLLDQGLPGNQNSNQPSADPFAPYGGHAVQPAAPDPVPACNR